MLFCRKTFSLFQSQETMIKRMSEFDSGNSVNCVLLEVNLCKKRGKNNWSPIPTVLTVCLSRRSCWILSELLTSDTP